ncbi:hypothetical protein RSAG8_10306, partial [Rhizoctonia solani AG-8 WAC10335]
MVTTRLWKLTLASSLIMLSKACTMVKQGSQCTLTPGGEGVDDSQAMIDAFDRCGQNGHVIFQNATTYHVERVLNTTGLANCVIDIRGTLL